MIDIINYDLEVIDINEFELVQVDSEEYNINLDYIIQTGPSDLPIYDGQYEVVPGINQETILQTRGKAMRDNVTVREIPIVRTSNPQGGQTVLIG